MRVNFRHNDLDSSEGTILGNSYKVQAFLGEGVFGFVTKCLNTKTNKAVAIKVNKNNPDILKQTKLEMFILEQLRCLDPDSCNIVKWNGYFLDRERICLNFELLDQSLFDYMRDRNFQALSVSELKPVLHQLANALCHLSSIGIVHTDLKLDNLMVVDRHQSPLKVKIIDFGLACPVSSLVPGVTVQPLWYMAPEVMINAPFNQAIDMWSLGLIAAELAIGEPLYPGQTEFDVLRFIIHTQGQPPDCVLDRGFGTDCYFIQENSGNQRWRFKSVQQFEKETGGRVQETQCAELNSLDDLEKLMKMRTGHHSGQDLLVKLIKPMLHLDSNQRSTPLEVLRHPFFDPGFCPRTDIENTEVQILVLSQQSSRCQSKSPHSIDCSVQNPAELPEQTPFNMPVNTPSFLHNDLDISEGTILGNSYKVEAFLGEGVFGFVTKCLNTKTNKAVAIKVNKNNPKILKQAKFEMFILEQLRCLDPDSCNIVKWNGYFLDREQHICLNFELLDQSLFDYMRDRNFQALSVSELKPVLHQLANALCHLSSIGIVHTNLKPDNVMIVDRHQSLLNVKIINFGLACPVSSLVTGVTIQPLGYRAPEVMISAPFNQAIDMWSLGVIAAELAIGQSLHPGQTEFDVLRFIIHTQGQPPDCVLDRGFGTHCYFIQENSGNQRWRFKSVEQFEKETGGRVQETQCADLNSLDDFEELMKMRTGHHSGQDLLMKLIKQMLHLDSNQRSTPLEVLRHPFFDPGFCPRTDIENTEVQILVLSQQSSRCQSKSPHSIDCSVQNPAELPEQTPFNMPVNTPSFLHNDLDISEGTILGNSYKVEAFLGEGVFGFVTKCLNTKTNKAVAIKVNKNNPDILKQAKFEMFILEQLRCLDPDSCNIVKWNGYFLDREQHICLNFELLDQSLFDYMRDRKFKALSVSELKPVLHQLANALCHLSSIGIVHTNLKPDNVMTVDRHQSPLKVKIINFGLACPVSSLVPGVTVQPLGYRAPEVMISAPINQAIDMWSLGVIAAELAIGQSLQPCQTEFDVLRFIIHTQGQPPDCVLDRGFGTDCYFIQENSGNQRWRFKSVQQFEKETGGRVQETQCAELNSLDDLEELMKMRTGHHSGQDLLMKLIKLMLHLDSNQRSTPLEVLRHPFFDPGFCPRTDIENTEVQILVLSQQSSRCQSKSPHSINYQNPAELPEQTPFTMPVNTPSFLHNDLDISEGTILGNSYKVEAFLGEGIFGFVTKCLNTKTNKAVAIKVNKNNPKILKQAKFEMFILEQLRCLDPDSCNIVKWNGYFLDRERICLNFELLDQSLFDYMRDRNFQAFSISELKPVLHQLANALCHLSSIGIVHTDLKLDNLMVVDRHQSPLKVKIIDFGLACPVSSLVPGVTVQPLGYRAPEVMISAPFNQAIDMWSLGVIAAELAIGQPLHPGQTEFDVLRFIIHTQGQPPDCVLDRGFGTDCYFIQENSGNQRWRFKSVQQFEKETGGRVQETQCAEFNSLDDLEELMKMRTGHHSGQDLLVKLIKLMLHLDSNQRSTPLEVLRHPFFDPGFCPRTDIENTEVQILVLSQQSSSCQSMSPHSIDCSVQNPAELPEQTPFNMSVNTPSFLPNDLDISEGTILENGYFDLGLD